MLKIRHIAFASEHPGKAAKFYKSAFGFQELSRFGLDPDLPDEAKRPSGVFLTDGTLNIAFVKFPENLVGLIGDAGIHHFGVVVKNVEAWAAKLEAMGATLLSAAPNLRKRLAKGGSIFENSVSRYEREKKPS